MIQLLEEVVDEKGSDRMGETDDAVTPSKETEEIHQAVTQKPKRQMAWRNMNITRWLFQLRKLRIQKTNLEM